MANEESKDDEFIINLTIDGTTFDNVQVKVTNPDKTVRQQIESIVRVFDLPATYPNGTPRQYFLGQMLENGEEPEVLEFEDEEGDGLSLMDYNIKTGDHLHLIEPPLYGCPISDGEQVDSVMESDRTATDKKDRPRKSFWQHILYGCWL